MTIWNISQAYSFKRNFKWNAGKGIVFFQSNSKKNFLN